MNIALDKRLLYGDDFLILRMMTVWVFVWLMREREKGYGR